MNELHFREEVRAECQHLIDDLDVLEQGGKVDAVVFAARYRALCRRLALARSRRYGADVVGFLNGLAVRGHAQLYRRGPGDWRSAVPRMLLQTFPLSLRADVAPQLLSLGLFLLGGIGAFATVVMWPDLVYHFMSHEQVRGLEAMYDPTSDHFLRPRESGSDLMMFGFYIFNNIGIAFRTFASGVLFGLGPVFFVLYNGIMLGAAAGHLVTVGFGQTFFPFVIGHSAFELTAIAIAGGAGLRIGLALLSPGPYSRTGSLKRAAVGTVPIVYGFSAMLALAAFIEAFWSSQHELGNALRYGVGGVCWLAVISVLFLSGRQRGA